MGTSSFVETLADAQSLPETHFALSVEPATARPGSDVCVRYRVRNASSVASPPARLRFLLPSQAAPLDDVERDLPTIAPGAEAVVELPVRLASPIENGAALSFQAALIIGANAPLGSNRCSVIVHSRARLDGAGSLVRLAPGRTPAEVLVEATVVNDGDTHASGITLVVPPPFGTRTIDGAAVPTFPIERLAAGEEIRFSYLVELTSPPARALRASGAYLRNEHGPLAALATSSPFSLTPSLAAPVVTCRTDGRRRHITIALCNDGWATVEDAVMHLTWPPEFRCADGSFALDGIARSKDQTRARSACTFALSRIAPQQLATVDFDLFAIGDGAGGDIDVHITAGDIAVVAQTPLEPHVSRAIGMRIATQPDIAVDAGTRATIGVDLVNSGDGVRAISFAMTGPVTALRIDGKARGPHETLRLAPGTVRTLALDIIIPPDAADGEAVSCAIIAFEAGERIAEAAATLIARDRVWLDTNAWFVTDDTGAYVELTNRGTTPARDAVLMLDAGGAPVVLGDIAPGSSVKASVAAPAVASGATVTFSGGRTLRLEPAPLATPPANEVAAFFAAPETAYAGIGIPVVLHISCSQTVRSLTIRSATSDDAHIVTGSTRVNDLPLIDTTCGSVLASDDGLTLHSVPAQAPIALAWSIVVDSALQADRSVVLSAELDADGTPCTVESGPILVYARQAFAAAPHALPFHVDGIAFASTPAMTEVLTTGAPNELCAPIAGDDIDALPFDFDLSALAEKRDAGDAERKPLRLIVHLTPDRVASIARLLRGAVMPGLVSHVFALRALFPDVVGSDDPNVAEALALERDALRSVLDRLYVKMRIPGFGVTASDCEDVTARRSLTALLNTVTEHSDRDGAAIHDPVLVARINMDAARALNDGLRLAPLGAPEALHAMACLLPRSCNDEAALTDALESYVTLLQTAFARAIGSAPFAFDEILATHMDRELDAARAGLLAALDARTPVLRA